MDRIVTLHEFSDTIDYKLPVSCNTAKRQIFFCSNEVLTCHAVLFWHVAAEKSHIEGGVAPHWFQYAIIWYVTNLVTAIQTYCKVYDNNRNQLSGITLYTCSVYTIYVFIYESILKQKLNTTCTKSGWLITVQDCATNCLLMNITAL